MKIYPKKRDVYLIHDGIGNLKIGISSNVSKRISSISTSNSQSIELIHIIKQGGIDKEKQLHEALADYRTKGEWFLICDESANIIERMVGISIHELSGQISYISNTQRRKEISRIESKIDNVMDTSSAYYGAKASLINVASSSVFVLRSVLVFGVLGSCVLLTSALISVGYISYRTIAASCFLVLSLSELVYSLSDARTSNKEVENYVRTKKNKVITSITLTDEKNEDVLGNIEFHEIININHIQDVAKVLEDNNWRISRRLIIGNTPLSEYGYSKLISPLVAEGMITKKAGNRMILTNKGKSFFQSFLGESD